MEHEITKRKPLLDENGHLTEAGYAKSLILDYDRQAIKANPLRIKEWDYYYIGNAKFGVALTVADNSYMGLDSISLLDFKEGWEITKSPIQLMTNGKKEMPPTSVTGDVHSWGKDYSIFFENLGETRIIDFSMERFSVKKNIAGRLELTCPAMDTMVIATPFAENDKTFYYNQKINCMTAKGSVYFDGREYRFSPENSFAVLDWGRGVWTYKNTWYWGSASGKLDGVPFGFNLGYGFGNTAAASENMLFYNGKAHKLSKVAFEIPQKDGRDDFMSPWHVSSPDHRLKMYFVPTLNRKSKTNLLLLASDQNQVFGQFFGTVVLDNGKELLIHDFPGFAEKVMNQW